MKLELVNVGVRFGRHQALDGLRMRLPERGLVLIAGPNGAGKSTLLDVIGGDLRPNIGRIVDASTHARLSRHELRRNSVRLYQRIVAPDDVRASELLEFAVGYNEPADLLARPSNASPPEPLVDLLGQGPMRDALARRFGSMSIGQQRLALLTCVLSRKKRLYLLDEPLAGVGSDVSDVTVEAIINVAATALVVVVEQKVASVAPHASRIVGMRAGRVEFVDDAGGAGRLNELYRV